MINPLKDAVRHFVRQPGAIKKIAIVIGVIVLIIMAAAIYFGQDKTDTILVEKGDATGLQISDGSNDGAANSNLDMHSASGTGASSDNNASGTGAGQGSEGGSGKYIPIYIDVAGAVNKPMVVELSAGSRVFEAIAAAGGPAEDADMRYINRAAVLSDGDRVYIPNAAETAAGSSWPGSAGQSSAADAQAGFAGAAASGTADNGKININTADSAALQQLNGVGPSTAQKIIDYRDANGRFASPEEICNVSGIGTKTYAKLKAHITV